MVGTDLSRPGGGVGQRVGDDSLRRRVTLPTLLTPTGGSIEGWWTYY